METLRSERRYFGLLGNDHILVYYPIIPYQRIKVYRVEKCTWEYSNGTMVSLENENLVINVVFIIQDKIIWLG